MTGAYAAAVNKIEALYHGPILPAAQVELRRVAYLLERLGNPHLAFRSVHIAGSSGKGSTTTMIGSILTRAGYRTGIFRSPHLKDYTERIAIDETSITREALADYLHELWPVVEEMRDGRAEGFSLGRPALFEVLFTLAALYFRDQHVEWAAIETGLGGRLDASNTLRSDVAVITNISLEHTNVLGSTVQQIAREKAAIIKPGCHAVTAARGEALDVIAARAREVEAPLAVVGKDVRVRIQREDLGEQSVSILTPAWALDARLSLLGAFQAVNAATAAGAAFALCRRGVTVPPDAVRAGLETARVPGRLEIVERSPLVILDGAHNPDAVATLSRALKQIVHGCALRVLFAAMNDKNIEAMAASLAPLTRDVFVTVVPESERGAPVDRVAEAFNRHGVDVTIEPDPTQAYQRARSSLAGEEVLLVTGSLYLVGFIRNSVFEGIAL